MNTNSYFSKGILLAGGNGTRLDPATRVVSKQLLPVYDKPMVYYPLSVLILAGIRQVLVISTPAHLGSFEQLFGDGQQLGLRMSYAVQPRPEGIAQALLIGREFIANEPVALILGDNIFWGDDLESSLGRATARCAGATIFAKPMSDPRRYGVVEPNDVGRPLAIREKPPETASNLAVTGLYFYDHQAVDIAARLRPSARGELEITDVNRDYLERGELRVECLDGNATWFDAGSHESYLAASVFVDMLQAERGTRIGCIEEAAYRRGLIGPEQLLALARHDDSSYANYLRDVIRRPTFVQRGTE